MTRVSRGVLAGGTGREQPSLQPAAPAPKASPSIRPHPSLTTELGCSSSSSSVRWPRGCLTGQGWPGRPPHPLQSWEKPEVAPSLVSGWMMLSLRVQSLRG